MGKIIKLFIGLIALIIVSVVGISFLSATEGPIGDAANSVKNAAMNAALDVSGVKNQAQQQLEAHVYDISSATGLSVMEVQQGISDLAIQQWQVTTLPDNAQAVASFDGAAAGVDGTVTTYVDPDYVTIDAYGQHLTMLVPESAQQYIGLLAYL